MARDFKDEREEPSNGEREREEPKKSPAPAGPPLAAEAPLPLLRPWPCGSAHCSTARADVDADWSIYLICWGR